MEEDEGRRVRRGLGRENKEVKDGEVSIKEN